MWNVCRCDTACTIASIPPPIASSAQILNYYLYIYILGRDIAIYTSRHMYMSGGGVAFLK